MRFRVYRSGHGGKDSRYEVYEISPEPGTSVLDALFKIQEKYDDGLAFRYSCRGAVCGSCAMTINREPGLACRTQLADVASMKALGLKTFPGLARDVGWKRNEEVLIEPLPNLPVTKDLVVDMTRFYDAYRKIKPWLDVNGEKMGFSKMTPDETSRVEKYANCILCAACFGACPICEKDRRYLGPAALSWSLRFVDDVRETKKDEKLALANASDGTPGCEFVYNCVRVCPKEVAPAGAIRRLKSMAQSSSQGER